MSEDEDWSEVGWTHEERALKLLRDCLSRPCWAFSDSPFFFDGFSEGVCILGGIDPVYSDEDEDHYDPDFLPGGLSLYWAGDCYPPDDWLRRTVRSTLSRYRSLGLKGLVPVQTAILAADKAGLTIPWLEAASGDLTCALRLPPRFRTNDEIREQIRRRYSAAAGRERGRKDAKTSFLRDHVKPIFEAMVATGFSDDFRAASTKRLVPRRIADAIFHEVTGGSRLSKKAPPALKAVIREAKAYLADNPLARPAQAAFWDNVGRWLQALEKGSQQKKH